MLLTSSGQKRNVSVEILQGKRSYILFYKQHFNRALASLEDIQKKIGNSSRVDEKEISKKGPNGRRASLNH